MANSAQKVIKPEIEPSMYLQRPSSARSQDVSHVLAHTFRDYYTRESLPADTIRYLTVSRETDDPYHAKYVQALQQVQDERDRRMADASMLERHIMQAQAKSMSVDEKLIHQASVSTRDFPDLGLPPVPSYFHSYIDTPLMKKHNLITAEDFAQESYIAVPSPSGPDSPNYTRETISSNQRKVEASLAESPFSARESVDDRQIPSRSDSVFSLGDPLPPITSSFKEDGRNLWRDQVNAEERETNRKELERQQAKVNFLRNPKHATQHGEKLLVEKHKKIAREVGIKIKVQENSSPVSTNVFLASPSVVLFKDYSVGQVYEITLELKNISSVLQPVRVIPPRTQYFSVGLGRFPGENGYIAPGMSCHYVVRFAPDSLCDFDDLVTIQCQSSAKLCIKLQGRRQPPKLTLKSEIQLGECLIGGIKLGRFHVKNEGGPGKFCLMPFSSWPAVSFKSAASTTSVSIPPFEIQPPIFELGSNQAMTLEVLFAPKVERRYEEVLTFVCDNCTIKNFKITGEGQTAKVILSNVEGGLQKHSPGEPCDVSADHLVKFDSVNPYTYLQKKISITNLTKVELPFEWLTIKPNITVHPDEQDDIIVERVQHLDTVFNISPNTGSLLPDAATTFFLTFAPPYVNDFHDVLHLVLKNIPKISATIPTQSDDQSNSDSDQMDKSDTCDVTGVEIEVKGICEPLDVVLQPYVVAIPGQTLLQTITKPHVKMFNNSLSSVYFQWDHYSGDYIIEVEPPIGELGPQCEMDLELSISGSKPCLIDHCLKCFVQHMEEPIMLQVEANIKGPEISVDESDVNFGLVSLGETVERTITLRNTCRVPVKWSIDITKEYAEDQMGRFVFTPSSGECRPLEEILVRVNYTPESCQSLRTMLEIQVEDGPLRVIQIYAEVQTPRVCLSSSHLIMDNVFVGVPFKNIVTLINQTMIATTFTFGQLEGKHASECYVSIEPRSGNIEPRQRLDILLHFTAKLLGKMSDLVLPIHIDGMEEILYVALQVSVKDLSVSYSLEPTEVSEHMPIQQQDLILDFGKDVALGEPVKKCFYIKNQSAIETQYSLGVEYFSARPPTPPEKRPREKNSVASANRALLSRTQHQRNTTQLQRDLSRAMLRDCRGAAFDVYPASGTLEAYGEQKIEVTAYNDLWGNYTDIITCQVGHLDPFGLPIQLCVSGCPLYFQMFSADQSKQPILRLGTHVSGALPIVRQMRINNPSPLDIRIDWQIFNREENDKQLIDMIVSFGHAFPLLDKEGNEIISVEEAPVKLLRQPTDVIPNSPTSSTIKNDEVSVSREPSDVDTGLNSKEPPKLINVILRSHGGKCSTRPFSISPEQITIPARGKSSVSVSFTPFPNVSTEEECCGYALGYLTLDHKDGSIVDKVSRLNGYEVTPLRLEMTAGVKQARTNIHDYDDDDDD